MKNLLKRATLAFGIATATVGTANAQSLSDTYLNAAHNFTLRVATDPVLKRFAELNARATQHAGFIKFNGALDNIASGRIRDAGLSKSNADLLRTYCVSTHFSTIAVLYASINRRIDNGELRRVYSNPETRRYIEESGAFALSISQTIDNTLFDGEANPANCTKRGGLYDRLTYR